MYLYSTYTFKRVTKRFGRQINWVFRDCLKELNVSPGRRSPGGMSFHSRGPAAEKLLSLSLFCVRGTSSFCMSLELDSSVRWPTSDSMHWDSWILRRQLLRDSGCYCTHMGMCSVGVAHPKNWPIGLTMFFQELLIVFSVTKNNCTIT